MVLKGEQTDIISDDELIDEYESKYIKELFMYIDDKDIKDAVYDSFYDSKLKKNLVYVYNNISDVHKKARVRILTRMLWYNLIGMNMGGNGNMEEITKKRGRKRKNADVESIQTEKTTTDVISMIESETKSDCADQDAVDAYDAYDVSDAIVYAIDESNDADTEISQIDTTIIESEHVVNDTTTETSVEQETTESANTDTNGAASNSKKRTTKKKESADSIKDKTSCIIEGAEHSLPFARLYRTSVANKPIGVCLGTVKILSNEIHDNRVNVFDFGRKVAGWIDVSEII